MFSHRELADILTLPEFSHDLNSVRQALAEFRVGQQVLFAPEARARLAEFTEAVLASAPSWKPNVGLDVCRTAAEVAELLASLTETELVEQRRLRWRCALLYELANMPAISSAVLQGNDVSGLLDSMILRTGQFSTLRSSAKDDSSPAQEVVGTEIDLALSQDASALAEYLQGGRDSFIPQVTATVENLASHISVGMSATECEAFGAVLNRRAAHATRAHIGDPELVDLLREIDFPVELWNPQIRAIEGGLLSPEIDSWGFAAPTGTGKTYLTRVLILGTIRRVPEGKILYIVPSKALVHEVSSKLNSLFDPLGLSVVSVTPQLVDLGDEEKSALERAAVIVLTPEKADLLLRLGGEMLGKISLIVVDEAHHIESGTRGVLLELYLWRIKHFVAKGARFVFLSAVAPNIHALAAWMGDNPGSVLDTERSTRMRAGSFRQSGTGRKRQSWIDYADGTSVLIVPAKAEAGKRAALIQLAASLAAAGPVLIVSKGKGECETLAETMRDWLSAAEKLQTLPEAAQRDSVIERLDSRLEREMYPDVLMRQLVRHRIAYHHAGLPPRVRVAVEDAIRAGHIDFVFATTTLAEGVNFPFASVIVQSLAIREFPQAGRPTRYHPVTPRTFWNIAGRAGRPGCDKEGQVILFTPSLGMNHVPFNLSSYLDSDLANIAPVGSALARGIRDIQEGARSGAVEDVMMSAVQLPPEVPKSIRGTVNLVRVGVIHGRASGIVDSPEDILDGTFAGRLLSSEEREFGRRLLRSQSDVVENYFRSEGAPSYDLVAQLGLSLETVSELQEYVQKLEDWQISAFNTVLRGGEINNTALIWVLRAVTTRMAELEGKKLGSLLTDVIIQWFSGVPFTAIRANAQNIPRNLKRLEDLIAVIYSQVQYILPWGLYAMDRFAEQEARARNLQYDNALQSVAYLADAGVPNFNALRLTAMEIERVDATRLARVYLRRGGLNTGMDVIQWLRSEDKNIVTQAIRGRDNRRVDFDFDAIVSGLKRDGGRR